MYKRQVPWIRVALKPDQKIGVICGDAPHLTYRLFESCGVSEEDFSRCVIAGMQDQPEFTKFDKNVGNFDSAKVCEETVSVALNLQRSNPDIGAILLECTDLPPYAAAVQAAHTHCFCGGSVNAGGHTSHSDVAYTAWNGRSNITYTNNTAYVYLRCV